jgi:hypothetical protein
VKIRCRCGITSRVIAFGLKTPMTILPTLIGFEGSWVIYLGAGRFCNLWDRHRPYTLEEKCLEIYYWSQCVEVNSAGILWMNEAVVKERVQLALNDPAIKSPILQKMMVYRDPAGVYADGGCIDLSRDSFSAVIYRSALHHPFNSIDWTESNLRLL